LLAPNLAASILSFPVVANSQVLGRADEKEQKQQNVGVNTKKGTIMGEMVWCHQQKSIHPGVEPGTS
jgi:hypothetical protein